MIPALKNAEFVRYGVMHRNTFLNSPKLLDRYYRLKTEPRICFAGQITGVEGYVESCASGMLAGIETAARLNGFGPMDFPATTAIGALALYVSTFSIGSFQPMNINFGIIEQLGYKVRGKKNKNYEISSRSLEIIDKQLRERHLKMRIIVDAMGGDNAPEEIVKGAIDASNEFGLGITLVGREEDILSCLESEGIKLPSDSIDIVNAREIISMEDDPSTVTRKKKDSSMSVSLRLLKEGKGDACVSAGSTGALLTGSTLTVKRIRGIRRAAMAPVLPNETRACF
jgi:hypothetical protein